MGYKDKTKPEEVKKEKQVVYSVVVPGGYTMTLTMNPETERFLQTRYFKRGTAQMEKDRLLGMYQKYDEDMNPVGAQKPFVQQRFAARILRSLVEKKVNEGEQVIMSGDQKYVVHITVTNPKGRPAFPANLEKVAADIEANINTRPAENRSDLVYWASRSEK